MDSAHYINEKTHHIDEHPKRRSEMDLVALLHNPDTLAAIWGILAILAMLAIMAITFAKNSDKIIKRYFSRYCRGGAAATNESN